MKTKCMGLRDYNFKDRLSNVGDATSHRGEKQFHERLSDSRLHSAQFDCV